ncbi:hypothetical protein SDC9_06416 [bioreactor metagenome]|uniref:Uncharacterized protein n=1 Tax=bioreactor metagenome TaxID=1076179 RepID=A0A644T203_9ZZZZ
MHLSAGGEDGRGSWQAHPAVEEGDDLARRGDDREVKDACQQEHLERFVGRADVALRGIGQLDHRDRRDEGGGLDLGVDVDAERADHQPHRLRQHHLAEGLRAREAQGAGGLDLAMLDGDDRTAHRLGHVGADVDAKADHPGRKGIKLKADLRAAEIEQEQLDQRRRAADDADIGGAEKAERGVARQPRRGAERAAGKPDQHGQHRKLDGDDGRLQEEGSDPQDEICVHDGRTCRLGDRTRRTARARRAGRCGRGRASADVAAHPFLRDRQIGAVGLHRVKRVLHRLVQFGVALADGDAGLVGHARQLDLELAHRRILAADRQQHRDVVVDDRVDAAVLELHQQLGQALVGAHLVARLARPLLVRLAQRGAERRRFQVVECGDPAVLGDEDAAAHAVIGADEIDHLLAFVGDRHRADDGVVLVRQQPADDPVPGGGDDLDLQAHALADLGADRRVEADHLVAVIDEVEGRVGARHGDAQHALVLQRGKLVGHGGAGKAKRHPCNEGGFEKTSAAGHFVHSPVGGRRRCGDSW